MRVQTLEDPRPNLRQPYAARLRNQLIRSMGLLTRQPRDQSTIRVGENNENNVNMKAMPPYITVDVVNGRLGTPTVGILSALENAMCASRLVNCRSRH